MISRRRFELHIGNKELFWEIWRLHGVITMRSGKIGREDNAEEKDKDYGDYRTAEVEFDRLIRQKMQRGYEEVYEASKPIQTLINRDVRMVSIKGNHGFSLNASDFEKVVYWMVDPVGVVDQRMKVPDLNRWQKRALRLCRMTQIPDTDEGFEQFRNKLREITFADRSRRRNSETVPGFKFTDPQFWIINDEESETIGNACKILLNKRVRSRIDRGKAPTSKQELFAKWVKYNELAAKFGGYEVRDCIVSFISLKGKQYLGLDEWSFQTALNWLIELDVLDEQDEPSEELMAKLDQQKDRALAQYPQFESYPTPDDFGFEKFIRTWRTKTKKYRCPTSEDGKVPFYKFTDPNRWMLSEAECSLIAASCADAIQNLDDNDENISLYAEIQQFFALMGTIGGCEISMLEAEYHDYYEDEDSAEEG